MVKGYFSYCSGIGQDNEDVVSYYESGTTRLDIVCDGMSGYGYGKIAAKLVASTVIAGIEQVHSKDIAANQVIYEIVEMANDKITLQREALKAKLGATLGGVLVRDGAFFAFWLGDVRIYQIRAGSTLFCSIDHSLINTKQDQEEVWEEAVKHIVTASVSGKGVSKLAIHQLDIKADDRIIICSDGIWRKIDIIAAVEMDYENLEKFLNGTEFDDDHSLVCYSVET